MNTIKVALVGIGNCASALVQGLHFYSSLAAPGLIQPEIGGWGPADIEVVAAFDIDRRKVGQDLARAIFAPPNCTTVFASGLSDRGVMVQKGPVLDGIAVHMAQYPEERRFVAAGGPEPDARAVVASLRESGAEMLVSFLPVGAQTASTFYAECALEAGLGVVNSIPVFIASDPTWSGRFAERGLPVMGDDIKSQLGATILHRTLLELCVRRGIQVHRTYQLNTGGNTDFLNMLDDNRLQAKRQSKTGALQAVLPTELPWEQIHVGPSGYIPWQNDRKVCFLRIEGAIFGQVPVEMEVRLNVEDSPNCAAVVMDAIRCMKLALDRKLRGAVELPCAALFKSPPRPAGEAEAADMMATFLDSSR
jgi:myo-inositol-1-phosphate synthase